MSAAALDHANRGWHVFPLWGIDNGTCRCPAGPECGHPGKHPRTPRGLNDATSDRARIARWWQRHPHDNIGVNAGASGLIVLDLDGPEGVDTYGRSIGGLGPAGPDWCTDGAGVVTGRADGGMHLYFAMPDGAGLRCGSPWSKVDLRGVGGYVVAPPSLHVTGRRYTWLEGGPPSRLPVLQPAWVETIRQHQTPRPDPTPPTRQAVDADAIHADGEGRRRLGGIMRTLAAAPEGERNRVYYWAVRQTVRLHHEQHLGDLDAAVRELEGIAEGIGLTPGEVAKTTASALTAEGTGVADAA